MALGGEGGRALLAMGATIALVQRELNGALGLPDDADRPEWARQQLDQDGMWEEYRVLRGLDPAGRPTERARALCGEAELVEAGEREDGGHTFYDLEYAVHLSDRDRHELATVVVDRGRLYTLAASTNELRWPKVKDLFRNVITSFTLQI